jgi:hypothetical protein
MIGLKLIQTFSLIEFKIFESVVADDQQRRSASVMAKILLI